MVFHGYYKWFEKTKLFLFTMTLFYGINYYLREVKTNEKRLLKVKYSMALCQK